MAFSRSSFVWSAWFALASVFAEFEPWRRLVAPLLLAESARLLASSPRFSRYLRNSSVPSSTFRMRSPTCALLNGFVLACPVLKKLTPAIVAMHQNIVRALKPISHLQVRIGQGKLAAKT